jgi:dTDP-4-dehydrorhamnose 3,5-epimerase
MITVEKADIEGVLTIKPFIFDDHRGIYVETYSRAAYEEAGITVDFVQDDHSVSHRNVLRGLHGDSHTWKLVSCPLGEIYLVVLDARPESPSYKRWQSFTISGRNQMQVLVPPGCANGHLVLSKTAIFHYKQSSYYQPQTQFTIKWNDPLYNIWWPIRTPIVSLRDKG